MEATREPNEYLIQLCASAIRQHWSPEEERRRRGANCEWTPPDASVDLCRTIEERCRSRSPQSLQSCRR